ncbi:MAG: RagB/SusD family nutrient uptake outer membrane protein [Janthinobacterium lividum]
MHLFTRSTLFTAAAAAALALGTTACNKDKLYPAPSNQFSDQVVFSTPARIALQVNALYSYVKTGGFLGGRYQIYGDIQLNDFLNRQTNAVTGLTVWNHTETETSQNDVINCWSYGYEAINQINVFLAGLDANQASFATSFSTTADQYRGEARLLRALSYYSLLQLYARPYTDGNGSKPGLPLRLLAEKSPANNALARSSVADIYTQILADLNFAETVLPLTYNDATLNVTRAHRNTAIALKTRVYLSMANYASVLTEANKLVPSTAPYTASSGVANALNSSITAVFAPPQTTTESILSFPFTSQDQPGTQNQLSYYYLPSALGGNGEYSLNTADGSIYANAGWGASDARRTNFVVKSSTGEYFLKKYPTGTPYTDSAPVIRYAEVMLNLAEARVRTNGAADAQALALLNAVRTRSSGTAYTGFTSATDFINAILLERRIEFLGEGIRYFDIMRTLSPIPSKGVAIAVQPADQLYIWPIPITEITSNPLVTRN